MKKDASTADHIDRDILLEQEIIEKYEKDIELKDEFADINELVDEEEK